jgi:hypothetical protein
MGVISVDGIKYTFKKHNSIKVKEEKYSTIRNET